MREKVKFWFSAWLRLRTVKFAFAGLCLVTSLVARPTTPFQDPSNHKIQFVTVEEGVKLEVLDWGGTGRPIVLLAGYQTAHVYDNLAPKLTRIGHVYGITRRGYGASSCPDHGYTAQDSANDVLHVLDSLRLSAPVLVAHGFGGQDLITIGAQHSDRVAGLVFLNSAEDPTLAFSAFGVEQVDFEKLPVALREPPPPDTSSFEAYQQWQMRTHGVIFPESELRQQFAANPDGTVGKLMFSQLARDAIFKGRQKPDYQHIRVPVLALFALPQPLEDQIKKYKPQNEEERAALAQQYAISQAIAKKHMRDLRKGVPTAHIVTIVGANYFIFLSNETDVLREMRAFIQALK